MKRLAAVLVLISTSALHAGGRGCRCSRSDESTRRGGNEWVVIAQRRAYREMSGKVASPDGGGMGGALVEVFDRPEYLLCEWEPGKPNDCTTEPPAKQRRLAACVTGDDGRFCFENLAPGRYELRVSYGSGWNVTHVYVVVDPKGRASSSRYITVGLTLGT